MRKLTEAEVKELRACKYEINGNKLYWDKLTKIYADDPEVLERIKFEKDYLLCLEAIPYEFPCHWKTQQTYLQTVDEFNEMVGYTPEPKEDKHFENNLLEKIAATFGIDIDINGDGVTSFEKYRRNKSK